MKALEIENLYLKLTKELYVLYNVNLSVEQGEHIVLLGQKGSGRTPLLRCICGLEKSYEGNISINGQDLKEYDFAGTYQIGYLPSFPVFFDAKTVRYNMQYVLKNRKVDKTLIETKINDVLTEFGLNRIADNYMYQLTEFERFLVALARLKLRTLNLFIIDSFEDRFSPDEVETINKHIASMISQETTVIKSLDKINEYYKTYKKYNMKLGSLTANN